MLALGDEPSHETAWARGAGGEEQVAEILARCLSDDVVVLHDRRIPGSRANIDHIAIAPSGVWVIDTKRYRGKVAISTPLFGKAKLPIAGRDKTTLNNSLATQVALTEAVIGDITPAIAVHGTLCFVDADLPILRTLTINGYPLLYPRALAKRINAPGPLTDQTVRVIAAQIARRFGPA
jgi:hypothetical protein